MHAESSNGDPFAKVKSLISEMIAKLEEEASAGATHNAYGDRDAGCCSELPRHVEETEFRSPRTARESGQLRLDVDVVPLGQITQMCSSGGTFPSWMDSLSTRCVLQRLGCRA